MQHVCKHWHFEIEVRERNRRLKYICVVDSGQPAQTVTHTVILVLGITSVTFEWIIRLSTVHFVIEYCMILMSMPVVC